MAYSDSLESIMNGIDVIENLANGERAEGAGAYWEDAEEFFRQATWSILHDQEEWQRRGGDLIDPFGQMYQ